MTTAKDASILVSVSQPDPAAANRASEPTRTPRVFHHPSYGVFVDYGFPKGALYRIGVVDLDDKTCKTLEHYFEHDTDILNAVKMIHYPR
ncbi:unnamed protein product [Phytomonas sp. Hart1]|nr:unnamed protein product [Phytomonas sp. Hart1]|eukprot:CCW66436.1 unnamed protein product [Phytomonas sp. isolate Hart1]